MSAFLIFQTFGVSIDAQMKVLEALLANLKKSPLEHKVKAVTWDPYPLKNPPREAQLTQDYLWAVSIYKHCRFSSSMLGLILLQALGRYFRDGDFVIPETGTSAYGIPASSLKHVKDVQMFSQTIFGSIGYATGAAVGAFVAGKELGTIKRGILVTGEGSLQLTVQAFSDLIRHEVNATV
jgi:pyruvate decarboxylase